MVFMIILLHRKQHHALLVRINRPQILQQRLLVCLWRVCAFWHRNLSRFYFVVEELFHIRVALLVNITAGALLMHVVEEVPDPDCLVDMLRY